MADNIERELGWDDEIEKEGSDWVLLPEGDYAFTITKFERARFAGSAKLPPCNQANVTVHIETPDGVADINHALFLHTKTEGLLTAFFTAIGQRKHGERVTMNWNQVIGATGKCKIYVDNWTDKEGNERQNNKVKKFYEPEANATLFTPGSF